jgi:hypothetical protein
MTKKTSHEDQDQKDVDYNQQDKNYNQQDEMNNMATMRTIKTKITHNKMKIMISKTKGTI